jgi:multidrug transporter EmrE-like cation transporter
MTARLLVLILAMIAGMVAANLLLKSGAVATGWRPLAAGPVLNLRVAAGLGTYVLCAGLYIVVLRDLPLSLAQSFLAAQFVAIILASRVVLGEPIDPVRWVGIGLIAAGIAVVGLSWSPA